MSLDEAIDARIAAAARAFITAEAIQAATIPHFEATLRRVLRDPDALEPLARRVAALVAPQGAKLKHWCKTNSIPYSTGLSLVKSGKLRANRVGRSWIVDALQFRGEREIAQAAAKARAR